MFPLELGNFTRDELKRHEQEHPLCEFCKIRVYSGDDLFEHMRSMHFTCDVCQRNGSFVHFDNADTLVSHLRYTRSALEQHALAALAACPIAGALASANLLVPWLHLLQVCDGVILLEQSFTATLWLSLQEGHGVQVRAGQVLGKVAGPLFYRWCIVIWVHQW